MYFAAGLDARKINMQQSSTMLKQKYPSESNSNLAGVTGASQGGGAISIMRPRMSSEKKVKSVAKVANLNATKGIQGCSRGRNKTNVVSTQFRQT